MGLKHNKSNNENETKISRTKLYHFLMWLNMHFHVRLSKTNMNRSIWFELVRFRNSVSSRSFSYLTLQFSLLFSYWNVKVENRCRPFSSLVVTCPRVNWGRVITFHPKQHSPSSKVGRELQDPRSCSTLIDGPFIYRRQLRLGCWWDTWRSAEPSWCRTSRHDPRRTYGRNDGLSAALKAVEHFGTS